jgi:hypothetical protein
MTSETLLLFLGPILALVAGIAIFAIGGGFERRRSRHAPGE